MSGAMHMDELLLAGRRSSSARHLDVCGMTHIGQRRNSNEDQFLVAELTRHLRVLQSSVDDLRSGGATCQGHLLAVADGMGGHAGGGIASAIAIRTVATSALNALPWIDADHDVGAALARAVHCCQEELKHTAGHSQLGTTLTVAYLRWPRLQIAHVGDSRCYLFRQGYLRRLTRNHTLAQRLIDDAEVPSEGGRGTTRRAILGNPVDSGNDALAPEISTQELMKGDTVLLCTDGLTKHVGERTLAALLAEPTNASPTCERLVDAANAGGGSDNITVVVARC